MKITKLKNGWKLHLSIISDIRYHKYTQSQNKTIGKDGKETIHDLSIQQQNCPYFKHLYKYLTQQEIVEDKTLPRTILIEKE